MWLALLVSLLTISTLSFFLSLLFQCATFPFGKPGGGAPNLSKSGKYLVQLPLISIPFYSLFIYLHGQFFWNFLFHWFEASFACIFCLFLLLSFLLKAYFTHLLLAFSLVFRYLVFSCSFLWTNSHYFILHPLLYACSNIYYFPLFSRIKGNHLRLKRKLYNSMDAIELMKVQARGMAITVKRNHWFFFICRILITISHQQIS